MKTLSLKIFLVVVATFSAVPMALIAGPIPTDATSKETSESVIYERGNKASTEETTVYKNAQGGVVGTETRTANRIHIAKAGLPAKPVMTVYYGQASELRETTQDIEFSEQDLLDCKQLLSKPQTSSALSSSKFLPIQKFLGVVENFSQTLKTVSVKLVFPNPAEHVSIKLEKTFESFFDSGSEKRRSVVRVTVFGQAKEIPSHIFNLIVPKKGMSVGAIAGTGLMGIAAILAVAEYGFDHKVSTLFATSHSSEDDESEDGDQPEDELAALPTTPLVNDRISDPFLFARHIAGSLSRKMAQWGTTYLLIKTPTQDIAVDPAFAYNPRDTWMIIENALIFPENLGAHGNLTHDNLVNAAVARTTAKHQDSGLIPRVLLIYAEDLCKIHQDKIKNFRTLPRQGSMDKSTDGSWYTPTTVIVLTKNTDNWNEQAAVGNSQRLFEDQNVIVKTISLDGKSEQGLATEIFTILHKIYRDTTYLNY